VSKTTQVAAAILLFGSVLGYVNYAKSADAKTTIEVGAKASSASDGRGQVQGHVEVKSGDAAHGGQVGGRVDASQSTDGKAAQSAEVTFKKDF
jgi:hypothetical protein